MKRAEPRSSVAVPRFDYSRIRLNAYRLRRTNHRISAMEAGEPSRARPGSLPRSPIRTQSGSLGPRRPLTRRTASATAVGSTDPFWSIDVPIRSRSVQVVARRRRAATLCRTGSGRPTRRPEARRCFWPGRRFTRRAQKRDPGNKGRGDGRLLGTGPLIPGGRTCRPPIPRPRAAETRPDLFPHGAFCSGGQRRPSGMFQPEAGRSARSPTTSASARSA